MIVFISNGVLFVVMNYEITLFSPKIITINENDCCTCFENCRIGNINALIGAQFVLYKVIRPSVDNV